MKLASTIGIFSLAVSVQGWAFSPKKSRAIWKKGFLAGAASAVVVGTATAAGAAVIVNNQINNRPIPYEPALGSLDGEVVVITGGSTGMGLESAKRLAVGGATVVLTSRTFSKGEKAVESVKEYLRNKGIEDTSKVFNLILDLDNVENVKTFPESYKQLGLGSIDVLMNNAGVMAIPDLQLTEDGYERTFQSNHLGHFVLTAGLYPFLSRKQATVINVSSDALNFASGGLDFENLNGEKKYGPWTSYGYSKLANALFTQELQRRAESAGDGSWLTTVALHPGAVSTDLGRYLIGEEKYNEMKTRGASGLESLAQNALAVFLKTVPEGASTQVYLAAGADGALKKGAFYEEMKEKKNLPAFAKDTAAAKSLWEKSEELAGIKFDIIREVSISESAVVEVKGETEA